MEGPSSNMHGDPLKLIECAARIVHALDAEEAAKIPSPLATVYATEFTHPTKCAEKRIAKLEKEAMNFFNVAFQMVKPQEVLVALNGGKDSVVALDLIAKYFAMNQPLAEICLPVLVIKIEDGFEELEPVIAECLKRYRIRFLKRQGDIKEALFNIVEKCPHIKGVIVGSRMSDPGSMQFGLMAFSDPGWPKLLRIAPIANWTYQDVWWYTFIKKLPYCKLYEQGYTSLGTKSETRPNPHLAVLHPIKRTLLSYKHAAELKNGKLERAGRQPPPPI